MVQSTPAGAIQRIALTAGEPAGIGPELIAALAQIEQRHQLVAIADADLLAERAAQVGLPLRLLAFNPDSPPSPLPAGQLSVWHVPLNETAVSGRLNPANAAYVIETLRLAASGCLAGQLQAMVTAPVQKSVINDAGFSFSGHTEFLAAQAEVAKVVMMLAHQSLRVALVTTHLPLRAVADAITAENVRQSLEILHADLRDNFGIPAPRILVLGLNPHAGESGHLGREEIDIINPVIAELRARGLKLSDALPADTAFTPRQLADADAVLAMYHDQGLPVLKHSGFGDAVNITLGLPFIRTSVDHGTALDLAGTGKADVGSLVAATRLAAEMAEHRFAAR